MGNWLRASAAALLLVVSTQVRADNHAAPQVVVKQVLSTGVTASGQPITLPAKDAHVVVTTYDIGPGARLPEHKHPFPRYAYVLSGTLRVTNTDTGRSDVYKPGDFIVEAIGQWHKAANIGKGPVRLLVIDQVEGEQGNTVLRH